MALAFQIKINHVNNNIDSRIFSRLIEASGVIHFVYEMRNVYGGDKSTGRIFYRNYTVATNTLSAAVDISGAGPTFYGFHRPDLIRLDDGRLICSYQVDDQFATTVGRGIRIKESADVGVTWGSEYNPAGTGVDHHSFGLASDGTKVFAVSKKPNVAGGAIAIHERTGPGTWTARIIFSGSSTNFFALAAVPQQNHLLRGTSGLILGGRNRGGGQDSIAALISDDLVSWSEINVYTQTGKNGRRIPIMAYGKDGIVRMIFTTWKSDLVTPIIGIAYSRDFGRSWTFIPEPAALTQNDSTGEPISWVPPDYDFTALALDAQDQWFVTTPEYAPFTVALQDRLHTFKAAGDTTADWSYVASADIINAGTPWEWGAIAQQPAPSVFSGRDYFRVIGVWNDETDPVNPWTELWLLKDATLGKKSGGGGGGERKLFVD